MSEETSFEKANKAFQQGQYKIARLLHQDAIRYYEKVLSVRQKIGSASVELNAANFDDLLKLVFSYGMVRNLRAARKCFKKAKSFNPKSAEAWAYLAACYSAALEKHKARNSFEKALEINPNLQLIPLAWSFIGQAYYLLGKYATAIEYYKKAVEKSPWAAAAWNSMGYSYYKLRHYKTAVQCFERAVEEARKEPPHKQLKKFQNHLNMALKKYPEYYKEQGIEK